MYMNGGLQVPKVRGKTSKRARDAESVEVRQLMCIPSISENIALKLLQQFGTMSHLRVALSDLASFPAVQLYGKTQLGKARLQHLTRHLLGKDACKSQSKPTKTKRDTNGHATQSRASAHGDIDPSDAPVSMRALFEPSACQWHSAGHGSFAMANTSG